jgi:hypothetical protein
VYVLVVPAGSARTVGFEEALRGTVRFRPKDEPPGTGYVEEDDSALNGHRERARVRQVQP